VYIFGSSARGEKSRDVDVLIVYDKQECPPQCAHATASPIVTHLQETLFAPIHLVLLSEEEERELDFVKNEKCVDFWKWMASKRLEATGDSPAPQP